MSTITIAVVQQMSRVHESPEAYQADVKRFMRQVKSKYADIVVFPELSGLMLAYPLISGVKRGLLKRADKGSSRRASPLSRVLGRVAGTTAGALGSGMRGSLVRLLRKRHGELFDTYSSFFSAVAAEYGMYVVGGSIYLYDEGLDEVRNASYLFDPQGKIVGYQEKLVLNRQDKGICSPGDSVQVLHTDLGRLGVVIGSDLLYPEPARAMAVNGADLLIAPAACSGPVMHRQVSDAFKTRVEENQLFGAISFLVGPNNLGDGQYAGKSGVLAPVELTAKYTGVLQRVGANNVEGFVVSECDLDSLQKFQEQSNPSLRHNMPLACGPVLSGFYAEGKTISEGVQLPELEWEKDIAPASETMNLDEPDIVVSEESETFETASDDKPLTSSEKTSWPFESE